MYAAFKDIWMLMMHRNLAATAKFCKQYLEAGKNLKSDIAKGNLGKTYVSTEPNEVVQKNFRGPVNYVNGRKKYALVAVDVFSHWPSASVCSRKNSNILRLLKKYRATHGNPRKLHMDQASGFCSQKI